MQSQIKPGSIFGIKIGLHYSWLLIAVLIVFSLMSQFASSRWQKAARAGAPPQRLLWASTGTKDPEASDVLYIKALAAPDTINTIPEKTLLAFADHGSLGEILTADGGDAESVIAAFAKAGIDDRQLAADLQREGAASFVESWKDLLNCIGSKGATLKAAG